MLSKVDGVLLGYLPHEGTIELKHISTDGVSHYSFTPLLRRATTSEPAKFVNLLGKLVRLHICGYIWQVERVEEIKDDATRMA